MMSGELDMAVVFTPRHLPDLHYEMVGEIAYCMVSTHAASFAEIDPARYIHTHYLAAFDRQHRQLIDNLGKSAIASGQNSAVCSLLATLGGTAFIREESAQEMIAAGTCRAVADIAPITQPIYQAVHFRHRPSRVHRRLLEIVRNQIGERWNCQTKPLL